MSAPHPGRLVLRADGNARIGLGHAMRLLALANILRGAFDNCVFATADAPALVPLLAGAGLTVAPVPALPPPAEAAWLRAHLLAPDDVLVLDGYDFTLAYQQALRPAVGRLAYVDDLRAWPVVADLLLNHSPGVGPTDYHLLNPAARLLLGPAYSLVRPAFLRAAAAPRRAQPVDKLLLCFGGADPLGLTARCLRLLASQAALNEIGVLAGPAHAAGAALRQQADAHPNTVLHPPASADEMVQLFGYYDAVLCPASTVLIEALLLGIPTLTGYYADNQRHLADFVHSHQQAHSIGNFAALTDAQLHRQLIDGLKVLAHRPRQAYAPPLRHAELRAALAAPLGPAVVP